MRILTAATPDYREKARNILGPHMGFHDATVEVVELPAMSRGLAFAMKPRLILDQLHQIGHPFWWVDADDQVLAPFGDPAESVAVGLVQNPERKVIKTDLWLASCVIYFRPCPFAETFLRLWDALCEHAPNDHRALVSAYYCATYPGCNNGLQDVTDCVTGKFIMTGRAARPDARM